MEKQKKTARPFGLNFVESLSEDSLGKIGGSKQRATTLALSIRTLPNGNEGHYDSF
jgi:hypothetical protein